MKNKVTALLLATTMAISGTAGAFTVSAAEAADSGTLKLSVTTGDGSTSDDKIPTPWYNRLLATNLMFRSLFLADSNLTNAQPDLADSYEISDDKLTYTITLKDGLKWSDGEELTAEDVKFSIETALKAATINSIYTSAFKNISDMSVDGNTITLTLSSPYASMIDVLAQFAILPEHCLKDADPLKLESDAFWTDPVCSGMYTLDELNVGNYFTLKRNENYEGEAPKIANVTCYFVSDYITAAQAGNADYVYGNAADMVEALEGMDNYTEHEVDVLFYKYFIFNMKGADGNVNEAYNGFEYTFDAEKAKSDLEAAGYDMSRTLKICYYNNDQTSIDLINTVVYYLEQTGITVEATLSNDGTTDLFTTRDYDIGFKGKSAFSIDEWYTEYMSTDGLFSNIFGGGTEFDDLVADLFKATEEEERNTVLKELQDKEQEMVYKVPAFTVGTYVFTSDNVKIPDGVEFCNPLYMSDIDFAEWEIAE